MATSHTINYVTLDMTPRTAHLRTVNWQDNLFRGGFGAAFGPEPDTTSPWAVYNPQDGTRANVEKIAIPAAGGTAKFISIETQVFEPDPGQGQPNRRITFTFMISSEDGSDETESSEVYF